VEGVEKGKEEGREETAKKMIAKGYDPLDILEISGISVERFRKLKEAYQREAV
jgi:DNA-binding CsgD family transcriptional regulator